MQRAIHSTRCSAKARVLRLDHITRDLVRGGELQRLIDEDGLRGRTSNPTIFQEAIAAGTAYDDQIAELARAGHDARAIFEALAVTDIQDACDLFRLGRNKIARTVLKDKRGRLI